MPPPSNGTSPGAAATILAALLALLALVSAWQECQGVPGRDYYHFWLAIDAVRGRVVPDIYSERGGAVLAERYLREAAGDAESPRRQAAAERTPQIGIFASPLLHATLGLLAGGDYERDYQVFCFFSMAAFVVAILLLGRVFGLPMLVQLLSVAFLFNWFEPMSADLQSGNVNRIQLLLLAVASLLLAGPESPRRDAAAGAVLAVAVLFKPNVAPVVLLLGCYWLVAGRWRRLARLFAGGSCAAIACVVLSSAWYGSASCWANWLRAASRVSDAYALTHEGGNLALAELIFARTGHRPGAWLGAALLAAVLIPIAVAARRPAASDADRPNREPLLIAIGAPLWVLIAGLAWYHYCILLVPLILWTLRPFREPVPSRAAWRVTQRSAGLAALLVFNTYLLRLVLAPPLWTLQMLSVVTIAVLIALALIETVRADPGGSESPRRRV